MFEIRSRMAPDMKDLKKHTEPQAIGKQVGNTLKTRLKGALTSLGRNLVASAQRQAKTIGEGISNRDPSRVTNAVKSDPKPLILLAVTIALSLMMVRKISNGRDD
jgi:hypothetical protein